MDHTFRFSYHGAMGTKDGKGGRYILGTIAACVGVWFAGYTGRAIGQQPSLQTTGQLIMSVSLITNAVQAFTDKRYPQYRGAKVARLIGVIGWGLALFASRK